MKELEDVPRLATLGERLAAVAERLAARHLPAYAWAAGFAPVLRRAAELGESWGGRFERHESGGRPPALDGGRGRTGTAAAGRGPSGPDVAPGRRTGPDDRAAPIGPAVRPVPVDVRTRLEPVAGPGAAAMRVRLGAEADAVARARHADGVTIGTDVLMRSGRYRPDTPKGFALLAHEAGHVTALLRRGGAPPAGPDAVAAEEEQARRAERAALRAYGHGPLAGPPPPGPARIAQAAPRPAFPSPSPRLPAPASPDGSPAAAAAVPMRADLDRPEPAAAAGFDVEALRRDLIDELMRRVRTDFERGG
ncbi:eCIS core domain-containing protein [Nonomuraea rubra]|uniref:eCIS core domain-containing protein n=1 Tax=Nonomuraea rubra TaxID=46180 RepID=UPI0033E61475